MDCNDIDAYKGLTPDNRLDVLSDFINDWSDENDFDRPDVQSGTRADDPATDLDESQSRSWYDPASNTIYFNEGFLREGDPDAALSSAAHELAHAQLRDWFGDDPDYDSDEFYEAREWYSDMFGSSYLDEMKDACDDDPPPESPAEPDVGDDEGEEEGEDGDEEEEGGGDSRPPWRMLPEEEDDVQPTEPTP